MDNEFRVVQVQFGSSASAQRYTYLAPSSWEIETGDEVWHPRMDGKATVCDFLRHHFDHSIPLVVLARHEPRRSRRVMVEVPHGHIVKVVPIEIKGPGPYGF